MQEANNWIFEETKTVNLGDKRLNKRYGELLNKFAKSPDKTIPGTFKSWKETIAAYRFFNHPDITETEILASHKAATLERIKKENIVLIPQDTTEIDFTGRKTIKDMGYLSHETTQGFYMHPGLAITPERSCLGIIDFQSWVREKLGSRELRKKKPIEEKETYCWLKGYEAANEIALEAINTTIISIADRESDIYELLEKSPSETNKAYWLVRSQHDRILADKDGNNLEQRLWESVKATIPIGELEFQIPAGKTYNRDKSKRQPRLARTVKQEIRTCTVNLQVPKLKKSKSDNITIHVVHCAEINPPNDQEKIEWFLLTSYPVNDAETAIKVVGWYLCRWQIETFFKILKSGCTVEELQFETLKAVKNCIALYSIVAWRILYLTMLGRNCPDMNCSMVFETNEWQAVYAVFTKKSPPKIPPRLNEIILMIAKLGGFLGRKSDGHPGPKVMWIGMQRMKDFTLAWETFHSMEKTYV
jgi:hypothetical protein